MISGVLRIANIAALRSGGYGLCKNLSNRALAMHGIGASFGSRFPVLNDFAASV